jgi:hypothetical protein
MRAWGELMRRRKTEEVLCPNKKTALEHLPLLRLARGSGAPRHVVVGERLGVVEVVYRRRARHDGEEENEDERAGGWSWHLGVSGGVGNLARRVIVFRRHKHQSKASNAGTFVWSKSNKNVEVCFRKER